LQTSSTVAMGRKRVDPPSSDSGSGSDGGSDGDGAPLLPWERRLRAKRNAAEKKRGTKEAEGARPVRRRRHAVAGPGRLNRANGATVRTASAS
jgi:hypothetical protein